MIILSVIDLYKQYINIFIMKHKRKRFNFNFPKLSIFEQINVFNSFNNLRKESGLQILSDTEIIQYIGRYCYGEWDYLRGKIQKNNAKDLISKEFDRLYRKQLKKERKAKKIFEYKQSLMISDQLQHKHKLFKEESTSVSHSKIEEGFIYFIINPIFKHWIKIGSTLNLDDRLISYQICDPYRQYKIIYSKFFKNRKHAEIHIHNLFAKQRGNGEWFKINVKKAIKIINNLQL